MDEADDVIEIAFVDRQPREAGHRHGAEDFIGRRIDVHRVEIDPRPHDVADGAVAEPQRAEGEFLFERLDDAFGRAGIDQVFDIVERDGRLCHRVQPHHPQHCAGRLTHQPDQRPANGGDELHNRRDEDGDTFCSVQRDALRHQLAKDQRNISEACDEECRDQFHRHGD